MAKFSPAQPLSYVLFFRTPWTVARQAPLSLKFSRQEYWDELLCPSPGDLPQPGIKPATLTSLASTSHVVVRGSVIMILSTGLCQLPMTGPYAPYLQGSHLRCKTS